MTPLEIRHDQPPVSPFSRRPQKLCNRARENRQGAYRGWSVQETRIGLSPTEGYV
jgi:hypothetical protein